MDVVGFYCLTDSHHVSQIMHSWLEKGKFLGTRKDVDFLKNNVHIGQVQIDLYGDIMVRESCYAGWYLDGHPSSKEFRFDLYLYTGS